jgi:hypothetical protein
MRMTDSKCATRARQCGAALAALWLSAGPPAAAAEPPGCRAEAAVWRVQAHFAALREKLGPPRRLLDYAVTRDIYPLIRLQGTPDPATRLCVALGRFDDGSSHAFHFLVREGSLFARAQVTACFGRLDPSLPEGGPCLVRTDLQP